MPPQPACNGSKHAVVTTGSPEITRHSRMRMVLTAYALLFPGDEPALPASTASHPNVRDDHDTPLVEG